jgi:hypothetical protein
MVHQVLGSGLHKCAVLYWRKPVVTTAAQQRTDESGRVVMVDVRSHKVFLTDSALVSLRIKHLFQIIRSHSVHAKSGLVHPQWITHLVRVFDLFPAFFAAVRQSSRISTGYRECRRYLDLFTSVAALAFSRRFVLYFMPFCDLLSVAVLALFAPTADTEPVSYVWVKIVQRFLCVASRACFHSEIVLQNHETTRF